MAGFNQLTLTYDVCGAGLGKQRQQKFGEKTKTSASSRTPFRLHCLSIPALPVSSLFSHVSSRLGEAKWPRDTFKSAYILQSRLHTAKHDPILDS